MIRLGKLVRWTSAANGSFKTKEGVVAEVVPPGKLPDRNRFPQLYRGPGVGMPRDHESYVVVVTRSRPYWPRANKLTPL